MTRITRFITGVVLASMLVGVASPALAQTTWMTSGIQGLRGTRFDTTITTRRLPDPSHVISRPLNIPNYVPYAGSPIEYGFTESFANTTEGIATFDYSTSISWDVVGDAVVFRGSTVADIVFTEAYQGSFSLRTRTGTGQSAFAFGAAVVPGAVVPVSANFFAEAARTSNALGAMKTPPRVGMRLVSSDFIGVSNGFVGVMAIEGDPDGGPLPEVPGGLTYLAEGFDADLALSGPRLDLTLPLAEMLIEFDTMDGDNPLDFNGRYAFGWEIVIGTVPAPSTAGLLGLAGVMASRRRRA